MVGWKMKSPLGMAYFLVIFITNPNGSGDTCELHAHCAGRQMAKCLRILWRNDRGEVPPRGVNRYLLQKDILIFGTSKKKQPYEFCSFGWGRSTGRSSRELYPYKEILVAPHVQSPQLCWHGMQGQCEPDTICFNAAISACEKCRCRKFYLTWWWDFVVGNLLYFLLWTDHHLQCSGSQANFVDGIATPIKSR